MGWVVAGSVVRRVVTTVSVLVGSLSPSLAPGLAHADATQDVQVVNVVSDGEVCGLSTLDYTSTIGPAKLALEVSKSVSTEVSTSVEVDAQVVSAGVGFNVTEAVTVVNKTEIDVPAGQFAEIYAFPMFENLSFEIVGSSTGKGYLLKPIGVCFAPQRE